MKTEMTFALGSVATKQLRSTIWRVITKPKTGDVYLESISPTPARYSVKFSLHKSCICRFAQNDPDKTKRPALISWRRDECTQLVDPTPLVLIFDASPTVKPYAERTKDTSQLTSKSAIVMFKPTPYRKTIKSLEILDTPSGDATHISFMFTRKNDDSIKRYYPNKVRFLPILDLGFGQRLVPFIDIGPPLPTPSWNISLDARGEIITQSLQQPSDYQQAFVVERRFSYTVPFRRTAL